jgi:hypothetical protein
MDSLDYLFVLGQTTSLPAIGVDNPLIDVHIEDA